MSQIKIEITFDPKKETMKEALAAFKNFTTNSVNTDPQQVNSLDAEATNKKEDKPTVEAPEKVEGLVEVPAVPKDKTAAPAEQSVSKTDVRAMATALSKKNKPALKAVFDSFGAIKLSDIPEDKWPELIRKMVEANA